MQQENKQEQKTVEARVLDNMGIAPEIVIEGKGIEVVNTIIEISGNLSAIQIMLVKSAITKTLNVDLADNTVAIARVLNNPTFGKTPTRIQLPKTSAARLMIKFQMGDATVEPQDGPFIDRFGLPPAFEDFTGREDSLALLEVVGQNTIIGNSEVADSTKKTVSGTGGIGKTQLAVTFAHSKLKQFQETKGKAGYRSIIWFIAGTDEGIDNQGLMTEQMQRLGVQLGFDPKQLTPQALIKLIYERLEKEHGPYLVVFDNAPNLRSIQSFCPPSSVPVIITTRNFNERDWGQTFKFIPLTVFTDNEAHLYIKKVLCRHHENLYDEKEANALATALGNFPLALTQALAYITNENMRITEYLEEFRQQKALYLQQPVAQGDPYQDDKNPANYDYAARPKEKYDSQKATVWAVIQLSLKKVINPNANQILKVCAYLAPEASIDINLLAYWTVTPKECREAIAALRNYSLLENVTLLNSVRIHQLVQEILKLDHNEEDQGIFLGSIAHFMGQYYEKRETPREDEDREARLYPHCEAVLKHFERLYDAKELYIKEMACMFYFLGATYHRRGNPAEAVRCNKQALEICERLFGYDNVAVAGILLNLGAATLALGDASEAKTLLERAMPILEHTHGPDQTDLALTLVNLGNATLTLGDVKGAKAFFEQALPILEHTYGRDHPEVASALMNLGNATLILGDVKGAKAFYERALPIQKLSFGPEHTAVAKTLMNLGNATFTLGDAKGAKVSYEQALPILERTFGPIHPDVAQTLMNIGSMTLNLGDAKSAKVFYEQALPILERIYGPDHSQVATTLGNLGIAAREVGDAVGAKALLERALAIQERTYGPNHPEVAKILVNLANAIFALDDSKGAKAFYERALVIQKCTLGLNHPDVAQTLTSLGNVTRTLGDALGAKAILEQALDMQERIFERDHPNLAKILVNLSAVMQDLGDAAGAKTLLERALTIQKHTYGLDHPDVINTLINLGIAALHLGDALKAKTLLEQALVIQDRTFGPEHPGLTKILLNLGNITRILGDAKSAIVLLERALSIAERIYGPYHPEVAGTRLNLGLALLGLQQPAAALEHLQHSLKVFSRYYGDQHPLTHKVRDAIRMASQTHPHNLFMAQPPSQHNPSTLPNQSETSQLNSHQRTLLKHWNAADPAQAIRRAAAHGTPLELSELLNAFADQSNLPDQTPTKGLTALHWAVTKNNVENVGLLLGCIGFTTTLDVQGLSALDYALQHHQIGILHLFRDTLIKKYSHLQITPTDLSKLVRACAQNNDILGLKLLIYLKVPCDEPGPRTGQTALHLSVIKGHLDCLKLLRAANANPSRADINGQTPLSLSADKPEIRAALNLEEQINLISEAPTLY